MSRVSKAADLRQGTTIPEQYITREDARTIEYKYGSKLRGDPLDPCPSLLWGEGLGIDWQRQASLQVR